MPEVTKIPMEAPVEDTSSAPANPPSTEGTSTQKKSPSKILSILGRLFTGTDGRPLAHPDVAQVVPPTPESMKAPTETTTPTPGPTSSTK